MRPTAQRFSSPSADENRASSGSSMAGSKGGSTSLFGAPISNSFLPTRSRRRKESTLLSCGAQNGSQTSTAAGAPFSGTPSPRCAPTAAGQARVPSPGDGTAWEALVRQINGGGWLGGGGSVLGQIHMRDGPIYSGNPSTRRGRGDELDLNQKSK
jgi:hypothetical protein